MTIAYIIPSLLQAGPVNVVYDLVQLMLEHGHDCDLYYFDDLDVNNQFPCKVTKINMRSHIDFNKYDIVHTHGLRPNIFVFLHKPYKKIKTLFITTFHNYVFEDFVLKYGRIKGYLGGYLFLFTAIRHDRIIALSKDAMIYYKKWYRANKLYYIYNTRIIDINEHLTSEEESEIKNFKGNSTLIGVNCSIHPRKGLDLLIKAMQQLPNNYKLFVAGDGVDYHKMVQLVKDLNIEDRVLLAGRKSKAHRYLAYYDIYAIPSRSEGFPLSLLEAACFGKKVVCSDIPVFKETFSDKEVSMFKLPDVNDLTRAIIEADKRVDLEKNIKKKFDSTYSPEYFYKNHYRVYTETL